MKRLWNALWSWLADKLVGDITYSADLVDGDDE